MRFKNLAGIIVIEINVGETWVKMAQVEVHAVFCTGSMILWKFQVSLGFFPISCLG
jgi:hypothetical protein